MKPIKSVSSKIQESLMQSWSPPLRISIPSLGMAPQSRRKERTDQAKRTALLHQCRNDLKSYVRQGDGYTAHKGH